MVFTAISLKHILTMVSIEQITSSATDENVISSIAMYFLVFVGKNHTTEIKAVPFICSINPLSIGLY